MSAKKIFIRQLIFSAIIVGGIITASSLIPGYYKKHKAEAARTVAVKQVRKDEFASQLNNRIAQVANRSSDRQLPVIFDNDVAQEDVMALILIGNDPRVSLKAITVAGTGEAHGEQGARNIADMINMLGRPDIPVAYGRSTPLSAAGVPFPEAMRRNVDNLLAGMDVSSNTDANITADAVRLMHDAVSASDKKVVILATGPLTNVAEFITRYPELKNRVEKIVAMGGAIKAQGNIQAIKPDAQNIASEWNFYADPEAVKIVFASGIPVTLVTLDATNQVPLSRKYFNSLADSDEPDMKLVYKMNKSQVDTYGMDFYEKEIYLWDQLTAMIMLDPDIASIEEMMLIVDEKNGQIKMADRADNHAVPVNVVTKIIHPDAVLNNFIATIKSNHIYAQRKFQRAIWHNSADSQGTRKQDIARYAAAKTY